jgi:hypothetical protein
LPEKEIIMGFQELLTHNVTVAPDKKYHGIRAYRGMKGSISCNVEEITS